MDKGFSNIIQSRSNAIKTVNFELINLYWSTGKYMNALLRSEPLNGLLNNFVLKKRINQK